MYWINADIIYERRIRAAGKKEKEEALKRHERKISNTNTTEKPTWLSDWRRNGKKNKKIRGNETSLWKYIHEYTFLQTNNVKNRESIYTFFFQLRWFVCVCVCVRVCICVCVYWCACVPGDVNSHRPKKTRFEEEKKACVPLVFFRGVGNGAKLRHKEVKINNTGLWRNFHTLFLTPALFKVAEAALPVCAYLSVCLCTWGNVCVGMRERFAWAYVCVCVSAGSPHLSSISVLAPPRPRATNRGEKRRGFTISYFNEMMFMSL